MDERPNHLITSIDNITDENNITDSVLVPFNIHPQKNYHISSELSSFPLQAGIGGV